MSHKKAPTQWAAEQIEWRALASLTPYKNNARTHSDEQIDQLVASIEEWGWTIPILIDESGMIIAGHGRVMAAERAGIDAVPVIVAAGWTDQQKRAYVLADNQLALNAGWDDDLLRSELKGLGLDCFNLELAGFSDLDELLADRTEGETDPDADAPEPPVKPVTQPGDLWVCGNHRLLCGDSTSADDVKRLLDGAQPHLMVTDPPYGVEYDPDWRNDAVQAGNAKEDWSKRGRAVGRVENDERFDWRDAWALFPGTVCYVWHAAIHAGAVGESLVANAFEIRAQIVWAKNHIAIGRGHYHWKHEPCWYAVRKGKSAHWAGDRKQATVWEIDKPRKSETGHSTQKPVECMRRPMLNNSKPGDAIYEPFCGSGTTMIAAEKMRATRSAWRSRRPIAM